MSTDTYFQELVTTAASPKGSLWRYITTELTLGPTTVGFALGGLLSALVITLLYWCGLLGPWTTLAVAFSGTMAGRCAGLDNRNSLCLGVGFALPGLMITVLLSPVTVQAFNETSGPWATSALVLITFILSFSLAGGIGAALAGHGYTWIGKSILSFGIGGTLGGLALAVWLFAMLRLDGLVSTGQPVYIGSIALAFLIAHIGGGAQLDAERRRSVRVSAELPFSFRILDGAHPFQGESPTLHCLTQNISLGGFKFISCFPLSVGDILSVELQAGEGPITAYGRIVRREPAEKNEKSFGLQIIEVTKEHQRDLTRLYVQLEQKNHATRRFFLVSCVLMVVLVTSLLLRYSLV